MQEHVYADEDSNCYCENPIVIIQGLTSSGQPFRPSDWAERLSGMLSVMYPDKRLNYSPYLKPIMQDGIKSVLVAKRLVEVDPQAYQFLLDFAQESDLQVVEACADPGFAERCRI